MKKNTLTFILFGGMLSLSAALLTKCTSGNEPETASYSTNVTSPDSLCIANPSWFPHNQTPAPEEGIGSPFDTSSTTNQIFHQWSWNKFLWLTKPDQGNNPLFLNQQKVKQVSSHMAAITIPSGATVVLEDTAQAGPSSAILQTNPDYNGGNSYTVYYSIHMNPKMYAAAKGFARKIQHDSLAASNTESFPVGSFELKVAWVPLSAIPAAKQGNYFTTTASLSMNGGTSFVNTPVALIGMHVVGIVQNHPEFIWATFEHDDLAPNYDWAANSASSTSNKLLFKSSSTSGINGILYDTNTCLGVAPNQVFDLFQYGIPRNPDGSFMNTSQQEPADFANVEGINQCVKSQLKDVWNNYFYNGSLWLNTDGKSSTQQTALIDSLGYAISNATPGSYARGSVNCANVTMETFTQTFQNNIGAINVSTLANCFSCHSAPSFNNSNNLSPLYLSHVFQDYLLEQQGNNFRKVEQIKSQSEQLMLKRLRK